jgi:hypothetical protein
MTAIERGGPGTSIEPLATGRHGCRSVSASVELLNHGSSGGGMRHLWWVPAHSVTPLGAS